MLELPKSNQILQKGSPNMGRQGGWLWRPTSEWATVKLIVESVVFTSSALRVLGVENDIFFRRLKVFICVRVACTITLSELLQRHFLRSGLICKETYCLLRLPEMVSVRILPTLEGFTEFKVVRSSVMLITTDYWTDESKAFCTKWKFQHAGLEMWSRNMF